MFPHKEYHMSEWRKPTFDEAQVVLREAKDRYRWQRITVSVYLIVIAIFFAFLILMHESSVLQRSEEILGYNPKRPPILALENFESNYQKQQQEIADAMARAESEILAVYVPVFIGMEVALAGIFLIFWIKTARSLGRYAKNQFEVKTGVCVRKLYEGGDSFYLTAFFEDVSTQEAKTSREVYYKSEPYSELLIVHLTAHKEWGPRFLRAYVIGPPIPPTGNDPGQPKFMDGKEEDEDYSSYMVGFESMLPPACDDPSQPNFIDSKEGDKNRSADEIGKALIGDEWKNARSNDISSSDDIGGFGES